MTAGEEDMNNSLNKIILERMNKIIYARYHDAELVAKLKELKYFIERRLELE